RPGRPAWMEEEFAYMGKTTKLLRDNNAVFHNEQWIPLIPTLTDSIYVNQWQSNDKIIYTIFSLKPEGYHAALFEFPGLYKLKNMNPAALKLHFVDLWNHEEIDTIMKQGIIQIQAKLEVFDRKFLNTRREGAVGCIAVFPELLKVSISNDTLYYSAPEGEKIVISSKADYSSPEVVSSIHDKPIRISDYFGINDSKMIIQLFRGKELLDERIVKLEHRKPVMITRTAKTSPAGSEVPGMVTVTGGTYSFITKRAEGTQEPFIAFPERKDTLKVQMHSFLMDKYPVTNAEWKHFITAAKYRPADTANYLKNWNHGILPAGKENYPVVYIDLKDALAYCSWAGKRLPSEMEWQYAAQGRDLRKYPWGNSMDSTRCNYNLNQLSPVNAYPSGTSPWGVEDLTGNVWQFTNDVYDNESYRYVIIRGGSFYHATGSEWYVTGGPVPADHPEQLLLISPSLDRNATVGFRCVKDVK
ncbi:MAG: formylglycine-generating enzyme family protein, partial [Syntrophothermus sp.]